MYLYLKAIQSPLTAILGRVWVLSDGLECLRSLANPKKGLAVTNFTSLINPFSFYGYAQKNRCVESAESILNRLELPTIDF